MTTADIALATIAGETAAQGAINRIAAGMSDPSELANAFVTLLADARRYGDETTLAATSGFHRAIQKRLEAI